MAQNTIQVHQLFPFIVFRTGLDPDLVLESESGSRKAIISNFFIKTLDPDPDPDWYSV
jgi:hypothetical protein